MPIPVAPGAKFPEHSLIRRSLQPNEEKILNVQFDSLEYVGVKHQNPDGTVTYILPQAGSTKEVTVSGENSLGHTLSIVVVAPVTVSTVQKSPDQATGIRISIIDAVVHLDNAGQYTVSFTVKNNSTKDIIINSLKVEGVDMPGSSGMTMVAGSTLTVKVTNSGGISSSDIGSSVDVTLSGQVSSSNPQDITAIVPVYGTATAQVLSP